MQKYIKDNKEIAMEAREQGLEQEKCISAINLIEQGFSIEEASKLLKIDQNIIKRALKKDNWQFNYPFILKKYSLISDIFNKSFILTISSFWK